jgi:hypothetical protein
MYGRDTSVGSQNSRVGLLTPDSAISDLALATSYS